MSSSTLNITEGAVTTHHEHPTIDDIEVDINYTRGPNAFTIFCDWQNKRLHPSEDFLARGAELHMMWKVAPHCCRHCFEELRKQAAQKHRALRASRFTNIADRPEGGKRKLRNKEKILSEPPRKKHRCTSPGNEPIGSGLEGGFVERMPQNSTAASILETQTGAQKYR